MVSDYQFVDFTPQNYHEMSRSQEKFDHASSIGTITAVPPPGSAVLELFEDYGSRDSIYSRSRQSSVVKVWPFARSTAVSVMSGSTGASLARQLDSTLSLPGLKDHSMFSQASKHTRDLVYVISPSEGAKTNGRQVLQPLSLSCCIQVRSSNRKGATRC